MQILLLEDVHNKTKIWLDQQDELTVHKITDEKDLDFCKIDAIITRGIGKINNELINKCHNVKVVARCGVGLDNVDVDLCTQHGIQVVYAPGSNAQTTAEHTMTLMLNLQRNTYQALSEVKNGNWQSRNTHQSDEVYGKTLGIVGFGNIGQKVATMASAFGMKVQYWSRSILSSSYPYLPLDQLQETSDILSIHVPLNPSTQCMIDHTFIAKCKKGVMFVNTARAQIFDRQALLDGLNSGYIGGYAADVPMSPYPTADDELNLHPKTLITAHVSSLTDHTFYQMCQMTVENVIAILKGSPVDPKYIKNYNELNFR